MKRLPILLVLAQSTAWAQEDDHAHQHDHGTPTPGDAQIIVTINPEARVSVVLGAPLPPPAPCNSVTELKVKVINQGFVTAPLRASIVGGGAHHATLHMDNAKLSGRAEDSRTLHLIPLGPDLVDVTIAFRIDNNIGDLGGRDRVHFVVRCSAPVG